MKITIDDVSDYLEQFHQYDGYAMACCPFHSDNSPSLMITSGRFYCKSSSCGKSGSIEYLYSYVSGRPIQSHKKVYNPSAYIWDKWIDKYGSIQNVCDFANDQIINKPELGNYLYQRKLTLEQIKFGHLGFLSGYYIFPIKDELGKIQGAVARASPTIQTKDNRYSASKDCPVKIYVPDWKKLNEDEEIYLVFGTIDAWSLLMAGYASLTGISGQQFRPEFLDGIRKPIYIIADKGEHKSAIKLQSRLGWRGRRLDIDWPENTKDPNGIHKEYGLDALKEKIEEAKVKYNYD